MLVQTSVVKTDMAIFSMLKHTTVKGMSIPGDFKFSPGYKLGKKFKRVGDESFVFFHNHLAYLDIKHVYWGFI